MTVDATLDVDGGWVIAKQPVIIIQSGARWPAIRLNSGGSPGSCAPPSPSLPIPRSLRRLPVRKYKQR